MGHLSAIVLVLFILRDRKIMRVDPYLPLSRTEHKLWVHVDVLESRNLADELSLVFKMPKEKRSKDQLRGPQQGNCMIKEIELPVFAASRN